MDTENDEDEFLFLQACSKGDVEGVKAHFPDGDPDIRDDFGMTGLMLAAVYGNLDTVQLLLERKASVHKRTEKRNTPLLMASKTNEPRVLQALIDAGAAPDTVNLQNDTPLMWAALAGQAANCALLLANGAQADHRSKMGNTPLMCACSSGDVGAVQAILDAAYDPAKAKGKGGKGGKGKARADINAGNKYGDSAVHLAVAYAIGAEKEHSPKLEGFLACLRAILARGASYRLRNHLNQTVLEVVDVADAPRVRACLDKQVEHDAAVAEAAMAELIGDDDEPAKKQTKSKNKQKKGARKESKAKKIASATTSQKDAAGSAKDSSDDKNDGDDGDDGDVDDAAAAALLSVGSSNVVMLNDAPGAGGAGAANVPLLGTSDLASDAGGRGNWQTVESQQQQQQRKKRNRRKMRRRTQESEAAADAETVEQNTKAETQAAPIATAGAPSIATATTRDDAASGPRGSVKYRLVSEQSLRAASSAVTEAAPAQAQPGGRVGSVPPGFSRAVPRTDFLSDPSVIAFAAAAKAGGFGLEPSIFATEADDSEGDYDDDYEDANLVLSRLHPRAADLDLSIEHVLGEGLVDLSVSQLGALETIHAGLLRRIGEARMEQVLRANNRLAEEVATLKAEFAHLATKRL